MIYDNYSPLRLGQPFIKSKTELAVSEAEKKLVIAVKYMYSIHLYVYKIVDISDKELSWNEKSFVTIEHRRICTQQ